VRLVYRGVPSNTVTLPVTPAAPGLFTQIGSVQAAVLNQDGGVNARPSPAVRGTVVAFFATGLGQTVPASPTGAASAGAGSLANPVTVRIAGLTAEVLYAGPAPGLAGLMQINARVPAAISLENPVDQAGVTISTLGVESRSGVTLWLR